MITTLNAGRRRVRLDLDDPEDHISRRILRKRDWYEKDLLEDLRKRVSHGVAIDVGAHIGNHAIWMAAACGLKVVALEPNPETRRTLERNVALNGLTDEITVLPLAAGARAGHVRLEAGGVNNTGMMRAIEDGDGPVPQTTIDMLEREDVAVIKIDVEGRELDILAGAEQTIRRHAPLLYVEAADEEARRAVEDFLRPLGYACFGRYALTPTYGFARATRPDEIRLSATIMAHPKRQRFVSELIGTLDGPASITWDRKNDRWDTGRRSLLAYDPDATHHLVVQDDAVICERLLERTRAAIAEHPEEPISLYLGRQRPHAPKFRKLVAAAREAGEHWIRYPELCWGVALIFPRSLLEPIVVWGDANPAIANYDMRISKYLESRGIPTWYTLPSLVDHRAGAGNPSLIPGRTGPNRVAHWFIGNEESHAEGAEARPPGPRLAPQEPGLRAGVPA